MIVFENVTKAFGSRVVYENFSASFGGVTAILGPSGCGKTTLLNIAAGLTSYEGKAHVEGGRVAYMFQQPRLLKNLTVLDNLLYSGAGKEHALKMLESVEVEPRLYPKQLSDGMAGRVSLARAFLREGAALLMDEPFSGLDVGLKVRMMELTKKLRQGDGRDVLFVTHSPFEAAYLSERAVVMNGGKIIADLSGDNLNEPALLEVLKEL